MHRHMLVKADILSLTAFEVGWASCLAISPLAIFQDTLYANSFI